MKIINLIIILCLFLLNAKAENNPTLTAPGKITVGIMSSESKQEFEATLGSFFKNQWSNCSQCELKNLSVYNDAGIFDEKLTLDQLSQPLNVSFLFLNFNIRYSDKEHKTYVEALKKIKDTPTLIFAAAGYPRPGESSATLNKTLWGQVPDIIILGEINERERMPSPSFFGPQLLTAIRPPRDHIGKKLGPAFFVAKMAPQYSKKLPQGWSNHLFEKKNKSRRIWPQVEELLY
jgi:hypothetical protein